MSEAVRNAATVERLCEELEANCGDVAEACSKIGVSTGWLKRWMRDDPKVQAAIQDAIDTGSMVLESAMIRRAVHGVAEPVFYKDEQVGTKQKYSDALLIKALESRKPEVYGKKMDINNNINVRHLSDTELDQRIEMLAARLGVQLALPSPEETVDAEFVELKESVELDDLL